MKRYIAALFTIFALVGIESSFSKAQAQTPPPPPVISCTTPTVTPGSGGTYPQNYLWACTNVTPAGVSTAKAALQKLGTNDTQLTSIAKTQMSTANHYIYFFATENDFHTYCGQSASVNLPAPTPPCQSAAQIGGAAGYTWHDNANSPNLWSTIFFEDRASAAVNTSVANTVTHEAGHQLDWIFGQLLYGSGYASTEARNFAFKLTGETAIVSAIVVTPNDTWTLKFSKNGTTVPISHTVVASDTAVLIASDLVLKINNDATLKDALHQTHASNSNGTSATILITSSYLWTYSVSSTGVNGGSATEAIALSHYDWPLFIASTAPQCGSSGIFSGQKGSVPGFICSGATGTGSTLNSAAGYSGTNDNVLYVAWHDDYTTTLADGFISWNELFADETAIAAGQIKTGSNQTQDTYILSNFGCSLTYLRSIQRFGTPPGVSPSTITYSSACK